jgi:signal transduction histidine kinase
MNVYVTDTGRGMDMAAQAQLFQRYKQTEAKDALRGSGLGLFISKKLVEQMGGSIRVASSAPGIGTTLVFTLPLAPNTPIATPVPATEPVKGPPSAGQV